MEDITVLFVDDEVNTLRSLERALRKVPYGKRFAENAEAALVIFREEPVHVVVCDMKMPGMDGLTLLGKIKEAYPETVRMVFSGFTEVAQIIPCINTGEIFRYVTKPLEPAEFKQTLDDAVEHYCLRRDNRVLLRTLAQKNRELSRAREKFRYLALHDGLTGLYNTRFLYHDLKKRLTPEGAPLSVIFMDMDSFKEVVDAHGHLNGSRALKEVARTIQGNIEEPAYATAYGGDEFVAVLPGFSREQALEKAGEIMEAVKKTVYLVKQGLSIHLGLSCGVAVYPEDGTEITELLSSADRALYAQKDKRT